MMKNSDHKGQIFLSHPHTHNFVSLFGLILYVPSTIFQLNRDRFLPVRKGPGGIQVNLNTWNLKKNTGGFFSPSQS